MSQPPRAASNAEWEQWGESDPFWGVASWAGRERGGENPWTPGEFYELGRSDWADFRRHWQSYGIAPGVCIEIGCGAGRLTKHVAGDFQQVIAVDVAQGMLATAREHVTEPNVDFRLGNGLVVPADSDTADGVFSSHVFQHFENLTLARDNFREIARVLVPGGTAMIHLPVYLPPAHVPMLEQTVDLGRRVSVVRARYKRRRGKPLMRGLQYSWDWLRRELPAVGLEDVELSIFAVGSNADPHPFVLARKPKGGPLHPS